MCSGPKPPPITITLTAIANDPCECTITDGKHTSPPGAQRTFVTDVVKGQTVVFRVAGAIEGITNITEGPGSDIFSTDPTENNNWTGVIGALPANDTREYTISYSMKGKPGQDKVLCTIDPKLRMK